MLGASLFPGGGRADGDGKETVTEDAAAKGNAAASVLARSVENWGDDDARSVIPMEASATGYPPRTMTLSVRVVGVGDAFTARYYNACLLVESADTRLLIDAPPALARALRDLGDRGGPVIGLDDVDHVLITHLHGDHMGGLEQFLFWRRFVTGRRATLHAIPEVLAGLWDARLRGGMEVLMDADGARHPLTLADYAEVLPMPAAGEEFRVGALTLAWRPTVHHIPTSALRIRAGAATFGYSADTAFDPSLIAWLASADLLLHETNHGTHTPLDRLVGLDDSVRERMKLIHYPDDHDVAGSPIRCACEGDRYDL